MGSSDSSCCGHHNSQKYIEIDNKIVPIKKQRNKVKRNNTSNNQNKIPTSNSSHNTSTKLQSQQNEITRDPERINKCAATDVKHCSAINRMMKALKEYESMSNNIDSKQTYLVKYCKEIYEGNFLNDYNHIIIDHDDDDEEIYNYISNVLPCNIMECAMYKRWNRDHEKQTNDDAIFELYRDLLDQIHCYILHSFEIGTRVKKEELERRGITDLNESGNALAIYKLIEEKREFRNKIEVEWDRFENRSDRYNICV